jgi:hypothetical protein
MLIVIVFGPCTGVVTGFVDSTKYTVSTASSPATGR